LLAALPFVVVFICGALFASRPMEFRGRLAVAATLGAIALETLLIAAIGGLGIEALFERLLRREYGAVGLPLVAAIESAGLWGPLAGLRWASARARTIVTLAVYAACLSAVDGYYLPFDVVIANDVIVSPSRFEYFLQAVGVLLVFALPGHLLGQLWRAARR
jgi:hypothetical protein